MKKYIAPSVEILSLNSEAGLMLGLSEEVSEKPQLSNERDSYESDWDVED